MTGTANVVKISTNANFVADAANNVVNAVVMKETGYGTRRRAQIKFRDCVLPVVDNAGVGGQISNALFDFPEGLVSFEGCVIDLTVERFSGTVAGLSNTWTGIVGLGTTTGIAATLTTTEQDLVPSTVVSAATAGLATPKAVSTSTEAPKLKDNTAGGLQAFLNILVDQASRDGSAVKVKLNGTVTVHYTYLNDK